MTDVTWWLMTCSLPDLQWARLSRQGGTWNVLESDGKLSKFASWDEAYAYLREDEYSRYDDLEEEDLERLGRPISTVVPPEQFEGPDLLARMRVIAS